MSNVDVFFFQFGEIIVFDIQYMFNSYVLYYIYEQYTPKTIMRF